MPQICVATVITRENTIFNYIRNLSVEQRRFLILNINAYKIST